MENSKNIEVVIRRFKFLLQTIPVLENIKGSNDYVKFITEGYKLYMDMYPNRAPSDVAITIVEHPGKGICEELYCISLYNSLGQQFQDFIEANKTLKLESAKLKRKESLLKTIDLIKAEQNENCGNAPSFQIIAEAIDKIEEIIKTRTSFEDLELVS
jgi:regulator of replication initiation timing